MDERRLRAAEALAEALLTRDDNRWRHTRAAAARAEELADAVPAAERHLLIAAAWLHDLGYAPECWDTGFHPVDGARYLARHGWSDRLCALVAHHSGARFQARLNGHFRQLAAYPAEESPVSDALAYADQTTGSRGERLPIRQRMADAVRRHGPGSATARSLRQRGPYLMSVAARVESRLLVPALLVPA